MFRIAFLLKVNTVEGRTVILWGQNPLYSQVRRRFLNGKWQAASSNASLEVSVRGEGIGDTGWVAISMNEYSIVITIRLLVINVIHTQNTCAYKH